MRIEEDVPLHTTQLQLKQSIFRPVFMSFPVLDRLGPLIPSRAQARNLVRQFSSLLQSHILKQEIASDNVGGSTKCLGDRLIAAWRNGTLTSRQFRDNLNVIYVAGQENPQLLIISSLYLLGKYPV